MSAIPGAVPDLVPPMQPSAAPSHPPTGPDWVVELGWTGHRCVAYVEPGRRTRLLSARDVSMTAAYPELRPALELRSPPRGMVLDGTLVARGEEHAPRARLLHRRSARYRPSEHHIRDVPVDYQVADLLWLDGHSVVDLPYRDRRALLEGLGFDAAPVWTTAPLPASELETMLGIADVKGVDALHARHLGSRYRPGARSPLWVKVPVPRTRQVVVGGWTATHPMRPDTIASLLLGVPEDPDAGPGGPLRYVGRVGVPGEGRRQVGGLRRLRREDPPFTSPLPADAARHAIWVRPELAGLVEFTGFVADGRLRLPRWEGWLDPADVDEARWARPTEPADERGVTATPTPRAPAPPDRPSRPPVAAEPPAPVQQRRLEQHFVYNALNTIGALIRTDPGRARDLLLDFADLSRAADQAADAESTLGRELQSVRGYLQLEQARFGPRLRAEVAVDPALHRTPVAPLRLLAAVRDAVQRDIEPQPAGGVLTVSARPVDGGCAVTVVGGSGEPTVIELPAVGAGVPG